MVGGDSDSDEAEVEIFERRGRRRGQQFEEPVSLRLIVDRAEEITLRGKLERSNYELKRRVKCIRARLESSERKLQRSARYRYALQLYSSSFSGDKAMQDLERRVTLTEGKLKREYAEEVERIKAEFAVPGTDDGRRVCELNKKLADAIKRGDNLLSVNSTLQEKIGALENDLLMEKKRHARFVKLWRGGV
ncbi:hypothetical protein FOZ63_018150 [Perkinsus olseni]|uniref:Uncharacterized protein n=1 Tax=Perkinsus olseni TaxID=32597 RepID=A0A7J6SVD4_PEROL|nr:hypothetical protein FOZ63_018150 [Perkinsus olseni]